MATVKQTLVHFASELALPPVDRPKRKARALYPKVAQIKGSSGQRSSYDLFWRWDRLSSVSNRTSECSPIKRKKVPELVLEGNDDRVILFNASEIDQTATNNLRTKPFVRYYPTPNSQHAANRSVTLKMSGTSSHGAGNSACLAGFLQDSKELGAVDDGRTSF
ncbi:hypothetical protein BDN67DRAFT_1008264 [Paxillus ammoniavirescens]|nr:hypothetical protein BDN67DRAFT_1008264 [Paxillus ammoniavirescens]